MKFSAKDFLSKCDQIRRNCGFGHIYWRNSWWEASFFCAAYVMEKKDPILKKTWVSSNWLFAAKRRYRTQLNISDFCKIANGWKMFCIDLNDLFILVKFEFPFSFGMQLPIALFSLVSRSGVSVWYQFYELLCQSQCGNENNGTKETFKIRGWNKSSSLYTYLLKQISYSFSVCI